MQQTNSSSGFKAPGGADGDAASTSASLSQSTTRGRARSRSTVRVQPELARVNQRKIVTEKRTSGDGIDALISMPMEMPRLDAEQVTVSRSLFSKPIRQSTSRPALVAEETPMASFQKGFSFSTLQENNSLSVQTPTTSAVPVQWGMTPEKHDDCPHFAKFRGGAAGGGGAGASPIDVSQGNPPTETTLTMGEGPAFTQLGQQASVESNNDSLGAICAQFSAHTVRTEVSSQENDSSVKRRRAVSIPPLLSQSLSTSRSQAPIPQPQTVVPPPALQSKPRRDTIPFSQPAPTNVVQMALALQKNDDDEDETPMRMPKLQEQTESGAFYNSEYDTASNTRGGSAATRSPSSRQATDPDRALLRRPSQDDDEEASPLGGNYYSPDVAPPVLRLNGRSRRDLSLIQEVESSHHGSTHQPATNPLSVIQTKPPFSMHNRYTLTEFAAVKPPPEGDSSSVLTQALLYLLAVVLIPFFMVLLLLGLHYWAINTKISKSTSYHPKVGSMGRAQFALMIGIIIFFLAMVVISAAIAYYLVWHCTFRKFSQAMEYCRTTAESMQLLTQYGDHTGKISQSPRGIVLTDHFLLHSTYEEIAYAGSDAHAAVDTIASYIPRTHMNHLAMAEAENLDNNCSPNFRPMLKPILAHDSNIANKAVGAGGGGGGSIHGGGGGGSIAASSTVGITTTFIEPHDTTERSVAGASLLHTSSSSPNATEPSPMPANPESAVRARAHILADSQMLLQPPSSHAASSIPLHSNHPSSVFINSAIRGDRLDSSLSQQRSATMGQSYADFMTSVHGSHARSMNRLDDSHMLAESLTNRRGASMSYVYDAALEASQSQCLLGESTAFGASMSVARGEQTVGAMDVGRFTDIGTNVTYLFCRVFFPDVQTQSGGSYTREDAENIASISKEFLALATHTSNYTGGIMLEKQVDSLLITYNAFSPVPAVSVINIACSAALWLGSELTAFQEKKRAEGINFLWGISLHQSTLMAELGGFSSYRFPYVYSRELNFVQKLVELCPILRCPIITLQSGFSAGDRFHMVPVDIVCSDVSTKNVNFVYSLQGRSANDDEYLKNEETVTCILSALLSLHKHNFALAMEVLQNLSMENFIAQHLYDLAAYFKEAEETNINVAIPNPYHRMKPSWVFPEALAIQFFAQVCESYDSPEDAIREFLMMQEETDSHYAEEAEDGENGPVLLHPVQNQHSDPDATLGPQPTLPHNSSHHHTNDPREASASLTARTVSDNSLNGHRGGTPPIFSSRHSSGVALQPKGNRQLAAPFGALSSTYSSNHQIQTATSDDGGDAFVPIESGGAQAETKAFVSTHHTSVGDDGEETSDNGSPILTVLSPGHAASASAGSLTGSPINRCASGYDTPNESGSPIRSAGAFRAPRPRGFSNTSNNSGTSRGLPTLDSQQQAVSFADTSNFMSPLDVSLKADRNSHKFIRRASASLAESTRRTKARIITGAEADRRAADAQRGEEGDETGEDEMTFQLGARIATGAGGRVVFQGLQEDGRIVAVKQVPVEQSLEEVEEAQRELDLLATLKHEHIVRYIASCYQDNCLYIVMEYISGGSLTHMLKTFGALPREVVKRYAEGTLKGLKYLHDRGIVHRDISANNIMLTIDGVCKLTDFGGSVALVMHQGMTEVAESKARTDLGGALADNISLSISAAEAEESVKNVFGTPIYMSPQACIGIVDPRNDVWSVGITLCLCLSGRLPWKQEDLNDDFIPRLGRWEIKPEIPEDCLDNQAKDLIKSCLQFELNARPTVADLIMHPFIVS